MDINVKLGVIGCGNMGASILSSVHKNNFINSDNVFIYDLNSQTAMALNKKFNFRVLNSIEEVVKKSDILLVAVKPFAFDDVFQEIKKYYDNNLILSILAGVKIEKYVKLIPNIKVIRIMPNTPALVLEGMSAICYNDKVNSCDVDFAYSLMQNCGKVVKTDEDKMDIITALSGSGPAFYFKIINDFALSASKLGLNYSDALLLSAQTALGSAKLILNSDKDIKTLIKNVTTPKGCTEVGNLVLENSDISKVLDKVINDTAKRAHELG